MCRIIRTTCSDQQQQRNAYTFGSEVDSHLNSLLHEPALGVVCTQLRGAVEDYLVAAGLPGDLDEAAHDAEPKPPAARRVVDHHILHMPHLAAAAQELALHEEAPRSEDPTLLSRWVLSHEDDVVVAVGRELSKARGELGRGEVRAAGELGEEGHEAPLVVGQLQATDLD
jgi:hypothetical protein